MMIKVSMKRMIRSAAALLMSAVLAMGAMPVINASAAETTTESDSSTLTVKRATIWPIEDVTMYDSNGKKITTIEAGTPVLAIQAVDGYLKVYYNKKLGLVDSSKCMINLPDVMQEEVMYDITNSYSSIYKIHGESIDGVTGEVLYPYVQTGEDTYLVPLLYPVAVKLYEAEEDALEMGYTFKIYDAYRPWAVTKEIYTKTTEFIKENPEYGEMMTEPQNGESYGQSHFLAKSVSNHNYGVAVDMTLADLTTGEELTMQSPMHELSTRSILSLNNDAANLLSEIMLSNGFTGLVSEWWHFQIKDYRSSYAAFQVKPLE